MGQGMFHVTERRSVTSTNDLVKQAIEAGEPEGFAVRAFEQTGGYGRQGRAWKSPRGGMYESLLLRPQLEQRKLPTIALVAALATRQALASLVTSDQARLIKIKWPNDIVVTAGDSLPGAPQAQAADALSGAPSASTFSAGASAPARFSKLAGISTELHAGGVCIGIGVNVDAPSDASFARELASQGKNSPVYLADLGYGFSCEQDARISEVGDAVLREFSALYPRWQEAGFASLAQSFAEHSLLQGSFVRLANLSGEVACEGVVRGIDDEGRLLLELSDGSVRAVTSGEVHVV